MRTLIIGCGYLGSRVAARWLGEAHEVWALTRSDGRAELFRRDGIKPVRGDVLQPDTLAPLPECDVALYAVGFDRRAQATKREVYVAGLENVLGALAGRVGRFVYVSSTSVYGQQAGEWVDEDSPCEPDGDDGAIQVAAETLVRRQWSSASGGTAASEAIILRFAGLYGPGRLLRRIESLRYAEPIAANPDGYLNLIHVDDGARIVAELARRERPCSTYLVTDDRPVTRREYYTALADLTGSPPPVFTAAAPPGLGKRCSNARLHRELGDVWQFPTIDDGLPHALRANS
jgi:nucleoside-diphosphate-sugar epimerase